MAAHARFALSNGLHRICKTAFEGGEEFSAVCIDSLLPVPPVQVSGPIEMVAGIQDDE